VKPLLQPVEIPVRADFRPATAAAEPPGGPRPGLADALRRSLVPSSVDELNRRGYREVKVLPREAVEHMVAEAAARLVEDRWEVALEGERARIAEAARGETSTLAESLEAARRELRAEREERQALERWREDVMRRLGEAEGRAKAAEATLADSRATFETQLAAVLTDPRAFIVVTPAERRRKRARALARRRVKAAVKRLARENRELRALSGAGAHPSAPPAPPPAAPAPAPAVEVVEKVAKRSFGFGNPRAIESRVVSPPPPEPPPAEAPIPARARDVIARLDAIDAKLDRIIEAGAPGLDAGVASRFRDGARPGLKPGDPRFLEKSSILAKLRDENVKLRKEPVETKK
jgi:hypothetical protein